jgi:diguanylate cyclase (GGDEF)-like protein
MFQTFPPEPVLLDSLTARARKDLDASLVHAIMDVLQPRSVTIARLIKTSKGDRWWISARLRSGEIAAYGDSEKDAPERMGHPSAYPSRMEALVSLELITHATLVGEQGAGILTTFELVSESHGPAVLEIETSAQTIKNDLRLITALLRSYRHMDALISHPQRDLTTGLLNHIALEDSFDRHGLFRTGMPLFMSEDGSLQTGFVSEGDMDRRNAPGKPIHFMGIIDIDKFHDINTHCGQETGDQVLALTVRILRNTFRHRDRFFRLAADQVCAIIRCANVTDAQIAFERFRSQFNRFFFPNAGFVTASIGLTQIRTVDTAMSALTRTQKAIEEAKEGGRDRIVCLDQAIA